MSGRLVKAVLGVACIILFSRLLGFLREMVIADKFGTSAGYDLYLIAVMLPALIFGVINFSSLYLFVPYLSKKLDTKTPGDGSLDWQRVWPAINLTLVFAFGLMVLIILSAPYIMKLWGRYYLVEEFGRVVLYCRLTSIIVILGASEAFMRAYLNVKKIFTYPAAGYIVYNVFCITAIIIFYERFSVGAIIIGLLGGLLVQNVYLFLRVLSFRPFEKFNKRILDRETKTILATGGLLIIIELINRSYFLIDRYVAQQFGEGVISALNYSQVLIQLPDSIIGFAIGSVVFPLFSEASVNIKDHRFGDAYQRAVAGSLFLAVPIAAFFFVNAADLVYMLFHRGVFDHNSVELTTTVLKPFTLSIVALFVVSLSIRACHSGGWARYVLGFAVIIFITKFFTTLLLPRWLGYAGITTATSIAHIGFALFMLTFIIKRTVAVNKRRFVMTIVRLILVGVATVFVMTYFNNLLPEYLSQFNHIKILLKLLLSGLVLGAVYLLFIHIVGLRPMFNKILLGSKVKESGQS